MKKIAILALSAASILLASCSGSGKTELKTDVDSASYAIGFNIAQRLSSQLEMSAEQGEEINKEEFLKGMKEGIANAKKYSYFAGAITGANIEKELITKQELKKEIFLSVFEQVFKKDTLNYKMTDSLAQVIATKYQEIAQKKEMEKKFGENKTKGAEFIAKFKKENPNAISTESGLVYVVEKEGTGDSPKADDLVTVNYKGTLIDGKVFDSSNEKPVEFAANQVIKGWTEMLQLMKKGSKVKVVIPQDLAYGENGTYGIDPYSTLVFEIELVSFKEAPKSTEKK